MESNSQGYSGLKNFTEDGTFTFPFLDKKINGIVFEDDRVKKLVIPEGVEEISGDFYLKNIQKLVLPKSLKKIGPQTFKWFEIPLESIEFGNDTFEYGEYFLSEENTKNYAKKMCQQLLEDLTNFTVYDDLNKVQDMLRRYERIVFDLSLDDQTLLHEKIGPLLKGKIDGREIGEILITDCLNRNTILTPSLIVYYLHHEYERCKIDPKPIEFTRFNPRTMSYTIDGEVSIGYDRLLEKTKAEAEPNMYIMYGLSHELEHARQKDVSNKNNRDTVLEQLDAIDAVIQSTASKYETGFGYKGFHDLSPDEIRADMSGYNAAILFVNNNSNLNDAERYLKYLQAKKERRIKVAHGITENGEVTIPDYRDYAYNYILGLDNLTQGERNSVEEIKDIYDNIKRLAFEMDIDLFEDTLGVIESPPQMKI